MTSWPDVNSR